MSLVIRGPFAVSVEIHGELIAFESFWSRQGIADRRRELRCVIAVVVIADDSVIPLQTGVAVAQHREITEMRGLGRHQIVGVISADLRQRLGRHVVVESDDLERGEIGDHVVDQILRIVFDHDGCRLRRVELGAAGSDFRQKHIGGHEAAGADAADRDGRIGRQRSPRNGHAGAAQLHRLRVRYAKTATAGLSQIRFGDPGNGAVQANGRAAGPA